MYKCYRTINIENYAYVVLALLPGNQEKNENRDVFDHPQGYHSCYQKVFFCKRQKLINLKTHAIYL